MAGAISIIRPIMWVGEAAYSAVDHFGRFCTFVAQTLTQLVRTPWWQWRFRRLLSPQFFEVGTRSVPVVMITGCFVGMVLAVQAYEQFAAAGMVDRLGAIVNVSVVRELGPVLAGIILAGRIGGALTAELGTMRVTEQIDAVRAMGSSPIRFLVCPRFMACLLLIPFLTVYTDALGVLGGWLIAGGIYRVEESAYWSFSASFVSKWDVFTGLIKSVFFGGAISMIGCYKGFHCRPGAAGVGRATTEAFVASFIAILMLDFFLAVLLQAIGLRIWGYQSLF